MSLSFPTVGRMLSLARTKSVLSPFGLLRYLAGAAFALLAGSIVTSVHFMAAFVWLTHRDAAGVESR